MVITLHNSKILLFLHCFLTQQIQTFTNLLIGIFRLVIPLNFFLEIGRNYVSIIVTIISNITVLQHYLLWIFVTIRRFLQLIVCIGVSNPPLKHQPLLFTKLPLKSAHYPPPSIYWFFMHPPKNRIFYWTLIVVKILIPNPIPITTWS